MHAGPPGRWPFAPWCLVPVVLAWPPQPAFTTLVARVVRVTPFERLTLPKGHIKLRKGEPAKGAVKPGPKRYAGRIATLACGAATSDQPRRSIGPNYSAPIL